MTRIAHISDTHFGTEEAPVCNALRNDLLREGPDLVVLSGDITQRARAAQFRAAREFIDSLAPIPVLALPGNHDLPLYDLLTRFTNPYRLYRRHIGADLAPSWENPLVAVIGVNSTRMFRHKHGVLSEEQVREVAARLKALPQAFKIVVLHHPMALIESIDVPNLALGAGEALAAWIGAGADLFLGGHIHLPYCIPVGTAPRLAVVLQAGTAVSRRRRGGQANSYHLIRLESKGARRMAIEQRDFDQASGRFGVRRAWEAVHPGEGWELFGP